MNFMNANTRAANYSYTAAKNFPDLLGFSFVLLVSELNYPIVPYTNSTVISKIRCIIVFIMQDSESQYAIPHL